MRKLLTILILLISASGFGQQDDPTKYIRYPYSYGTRQDRYWADKAIHVPRDTIYTKSGVAIKGNSLYYGDSTRWYLAGSGGVAIDTANKWVNNITRTPGKDSIIFHIGGTRYAIKDSTGGGGSSLTPLGTGAPVLISSSFIKSLKAGHNISVDTLIAGTITFTSRGTRYYVVWGQSNSNGYNDGLHDTSINPLVFGWNGSAWVVMQRGVAPMGWCYPENSSGTCGGGVTEDSATSAAWYFAKRMQEQTGDTIRLIFNGYGGEPISNWIPAGSTNFQKLVSYMTAIGNPKIDGVIAQHGEANGFDPDTTYKRKFDTLIQQMDAQPWMGKDVPIFITSVRDTATHATMYWTQYAMGSQAFDRRYVFVDAGKEPYYNPAPYHFSAQGQYNIGNKIFQLYYNRLSNPNNFRRINAAEKTTIQINVPNLAREMIFADSTTGAIIINEINFLQTKITGGDFTIKQNFDAYGASSLLVKNDGNVTGIEVVDHGLETSGVTFTTMSGAQHRIVYQNIGGSVLTGNTSGEMQFFKPGEGNIFRVGGLVSALQGSLFIGNTFTVPTAKVHIAAATTSAGTSQIKLDNSALPTTPEIGSINFKNGLLFLDSSNSKRDTIATRDWVSGRISGLSGGGVSGTVNSGTQYRIAYYATTGTAVSEAAAITAARVLKSDANGVPTHSGITIDGSNNIGSIGTISSAAITSSALTSGRVPIAGTSGLIEDDAGLTFNKTTNNLIIEGPGSDLNNGPKMSLKFNSDANPWLSFFSYQQDNSAIAMGAWFNGSGWVSSDAASNYVFYKAGGKLTLKGNSGTTAGSTFGFSDLVEFEPNGNIDHVQGKFTVGSATSGAEKFNVTGNVNFSGALMPNAAAGTSGQFLKTAGAGAPPTWSAVTVPLSSITAATTSASIDNAANPIVWSWNSATTSGSGYFDITSTSLSSGILAAIAVNSTAAASNTQTAFDVSTFGVNATSSQTTKGAVFRNTHTGTGAVNVAATFLAADGAANYAIIVPPASGDVGIGTLTPTSKLHVDGSIATAYRAITALRTLDATDHTIEVTANTFTVTLPLSTTCIGVIYEITNSGSGVTTIATTSSETFRNVTATPTTLTLNQFNTVRLQSANGAWLRLSSL